MTQSRIPSISNPAVCSILFFHLENLRHAMQTHFPQGIHPLNLLALDLTKQVLKAYFAATLEAKHAAYKTAKQKTDQIIIEIKNINQAILPSSLQQQLSYDLSALQEQLDQILALFPS